MTGRTNFQELRERLERARTNDIAFECEVCDTRWDDTPRQRKRGGLHALSAGTTTRSP